MGSAAPKSLLAKLSSVGAEPRRGLSQNFLIDDNILDKIVQTAQVRKRDLVLEIGPGTGALTAKLLAAGASVLAIEADRQLASLVREFELQGAPLQLICGDVLQVNLSFVIEEARSRFVPQRLLVVANLPYHLTGPILGRLLEASSLFSAFYLLVQKEVAERLSATPPSRHSSPLGVLLHLYGKPRLAFSVAPSCFWPAPKIFSALLALELHPPRLGAVELELFRQFLHQAFAQRRKRLWKVLKQYHQEELLASSWKALALSANVRIEELSLEQLLELSTFFVEK